MRKKTLCAALALLLLLLGAACGQKTKSIDDGTYRIEASLTGGTGRATIASPLKLTVQGDEMQAVIVWSSPNYDYMKVNGVRYDALVVDGHSVFTVPVTSLEEPLPVVADTVAMSVPHEIEYTITFDIATLTEEGPGPNWSDLAVRREVPLSHATQFSLTEYDQGYTLLDIPTSGRFLIVPQGADLPQGLDEDIVALNMPLDRIYLTATSSMDFFRALNSVGSVRLSGTDVSGWYIEEAKEALENGSMLFAGKYSAPDYELIFAEKCDLAIESTMIYHSPEVKEQLEKLGVPVLVERSSYEADPLGRMEWIKVYGALLGKLPEAEALFDAEVQAVEPLLSQPRTDRTVAFFYITTTGTANVRKSDDYVPQMIAMAGGTYVFDDLDSGNALSTVNMTMESFYDGAKNADILIYNSTIDGELYTVEDLLQKSALLKDFRAVQSGDLWCTGKNLFQEPMGVGKLILDIHQVLTDPDAPTELTYLHKLTGGQG